MKALHQHAGTPASPASLTPQQLTDLGNARRLIDRHGHNMLYDPTVGWRVWQDGIWCVDASGQVVRFAKDTVLAIIHEAALGRDPREARELLEHAQRSQSSRAIQAMIELARTEPEVVVTDHEWDSNPMLLNVANGTIDLTTGELRPHRREDRITMMAPVDYIPDATAPTFQKVVRHIAGGDEDVAAFIQRFAGYAATGDTREQALFLFVGQGGEGKSVFMEALASTLGDYAQVMPSRTLTAQRDEGIPNDLARLKGKRFVRASETEQGAPLAEAKIKQLTGGDTITARFMRQEFFEFAPVCKIALATNYLPEVRGADRGIWRRIKIIRCGHPVPADEQDPTMPAKLKEEREGILSWIIRGCLNWQSEGLTPPAAVRQALDAFRNDMDVIGRFIDDCCVREGAGALAKDLYSAYTDWCIQNGEHRLSTRKLGDDLKNRGFYTQKSTNGLARWIGLSLNPQRRTIDLSNI